MDAPPSQQPDCLICFGPTHRNASFWRQPTVIQCDCRPVVHRACWEAWAAQAGPICIICRSNKYYPVPPQQHLQNIRHGILFMGRELDPCTSLVILFFLAYFIVTAFHILQGKPAYTPAPDVYYPRRLEL
jgi:hypothetical protein